MKNDAITIGGMTIEYLIDGSATRSTGMFELTVQPRSIVPPPHSHADNDEYLYVLAGTIRYSLDGETRDLRAGEFLASPRGSVHGFANPFDEPTRVLIIQSPDIGRQYFADVQDALKAGGPPDPSKMLPIMARYNLKVAAPQPSAAQS